MLIIGHRGAAGLAPENTLESLRAGVDTGADILEFDVRLTVDKVPILAHNTRLHGKTISRTTLAALQQAGSVTLLQDVFDEFLGKIILNLEYKPSKDITIIYDLLKTHMKKDSDWDSIIVSSFRPRALYELRQCSEKISLALLHSINPFTFVAQHKKLNLSAVGWHRLHVNPLATAIAQKAGIFSYAYTVNRPKAATILAQKGIDGVVTDYPDRLVR